MPRNFSALPGYLYVSKPKELLRAIIFHKHIRFGNFVSRVSTNRSEVKFGKICGIGVFKCIIIVYLFITQFDGKETHGEVYGNVFKNSIDKINLQNIS